ncbi:hypothetical protein [Streptomyces sp. 3214.6]|nr:hypothetical protein [Streptomyces sp. 3214.6]
MDKVVATAPKAVADVGNAHTSALCIGVGQGLALVLERQETQETP